MEAAEESGAVFSPYGMFLEADVIVQAVMLGLAFASVVVWMVLIYKSIQMSLAGARLRAAFDTLKKARSLPEADQALPAAIARALVKEANDEIAASAALGAAAGAKERIGAGLERLVAAETRRMSLGLNLLASIGSTAPFVGLFGTVWGIMNSFIGIAQTNTTNLAVVAPGIAEALLATAIGLFVAIPAVIIYNHLSRSLGAHRPLIADCAAWVARLASRELDMSALDADQRLTPSPDGGGGGAGGVGGVKASPVPLTEPQPQTPAPVPPEFIEPVEGMEPAPTSGSGEVLGFGPGFGGGQGGGIDGGLGQGIGSGSSGGSTPTPPPMPEWDRRNLAAYQNAARQRYLEEIVYPAAAQREGLAGVGVLRIEVLRNGRVVSAALRDKTGHAMLDAELERAARVVDRLPSLPRDFPRDRLIFNLPVRFTVVTDAREARRLEAEQQASMSEPAERAPAP